MTVAQATSLVRKDLLFDIKKKLYTLSGAEAYEIAKSLGTDHDRLNPTDEESSIDHILTFMYSDEWSGSEDEGLGHLMHLNDVTTYQLKAENSEGRMM